MCPHVRRRRNDDQRPSDRVVNALVVFPQAIVFGLQDRIFRPLQPGVGANAFLQELFTIAAVQRFMMFAQHRLEGVDFLLRESHPDRKTSRLTCEIRPPACR
jgi:hypothetical protein